MSLLLLNGNSLHIPLRDRSVHMVVTSPPYYALRDYGTAKWIGGDPNCKHTVGNQVQDNKWEGAITSGIRPGADTSRCKKCGAIREDKQLGLEQTPDEYVTNTVLWAREIWRVLRDDGTFWLNLGDSYAGSGGSHKNGINPGISRSFYRDGASRRSIADGLKPKDLIGIPWRVALALQDDGWWLRSDIIWAKGNPMPESVTDRPTKAHEYVFLLSKSARYFYDADAVREKNVSTPHPFGYTKETIDNKAIGPISRPDRFGKQTGQYNPDHQDRIIAPFGGRNRRTVWTIATRPYSGAHFATFPPDLVEPCIKAGTSERGVCPVCGAPWKRVVQKGAPILNAWSSKGAADSLGIPAGPGSTLKHIPNISTVGWRPTCSHYPRAREWPRTPRPKKKSSPTFLELLDIEYAETLQEELLELFATYDSSPAIVLDPFVGSGTTLLVARNLSRSGIGIDLSAPYLHEQAQKRLELDKLSSWKKGKKKRTSKQSTNGKVKKVNDLPLFAAVKEK